jgi:Protein of unknown function (DUF2541)
MRLIIYVLLLTGLIGCVSNANAHSERALLLGSTRLSQQENDVDVLRFSRCRADIHTLQIRSKRGQIEVERLWVRYANGERETLNIRDRIAQGSASRWIDLRGGNRCIVQIGIVGDTERSRDQARVEIWAR